MKNYHIPLTIPRTVRNAVRYTLSSSVLHDGAAVCNRCGSIMMVEMLDICNPCAQEVAIGLATFIETIIYRNRNRRR
jgi:hypothetical protein